MLEKLIQDAQADALRRVVESGERFVIVAHKNPDGDAIGSSLALMYFLRGMGKTADVVLPNNFPDFLKWLSSADEDIIVYETEKERATELVAVADVFFCLDFNSIPRLGELGGCVAESAAPKILIDHHLHPDNDFAIAISVPEACSTSELVFRVICRLSSVEAVTLPIAQAIYTGMMTDTGSFAYASNRKDIYLIVAELISRGVDKDFIYRSVFYNYSETRLRLMGYALYEKLKIFSKMNASLITLTHKEHKRFNVQRGDTEGLVNIPLQKKGLRLSCFMREETPGKINVSLRSVGDFPCNTLAAEFFGGGGHKNASGGEIHGTLEDAEARFVQALQAYREMLTK